MTITTDRKYATSFVLICLTSSVGSIVEKALGMENAQDGDPGNDWLAPLSVGSGACVVVSWKPSESVTLAANEGFYLGAPSMKRIIVQHIQESATQRLLLEKGDVDVARNLNAEDVAGLQDAENVEIDTELCGQLMYISFNQKHPCCPGARLSRP